MDHCKYPFLRSLLANRKFKSVCAGIPKKLIEMDLCFDTVCVLANVYTNPSAGRSRNHAALHLFAGPTESSQQCPICLANKT